MLPVAPNMAATESFDIFSRVSNSSTFLPFAAIKEFAALSSALASFSCNFLLADTVSFIWIFLASKNLDAFVQVVQPPRM